MNSRTGMPLMRSSELEDLQVGTGGNNDTGDSLLTFDTEWLDLSRSVIEEKGTKIMARALESNRVLNLKVLFLHRNAGDVGMRAMLNALTLGYLRGLEKLILWEVSSYDQITTAEEGTDTIANALGEGKAPDLHTLDLTASLPKLIAPRRWRKVFRDLSKFSAGSGRLNKWKDTGLYCLWLQTNNGRNQTLDCLRCQFFKVNVYSGDDGIRKIVRALRKYPLTSLKILNLGQNYIGDKGARALAKLLADGALPHLEELDLKNNRVGEKGAGEIVQAFLDNPLLTVRVKMDWPTLLLKERASAFRECNIRLEHRLAELNIRIEHDSKSPSFERRPQYFLQRPHLFTKGYKLPHRLYMQCQAPDHEVHLGGDAPPQGDGIQIRRRSCFGTSSRKYVDRELIEKPAEEPPLRVENTQSDRPLSYMESMPSRRTPTSAPGLNREPTYTYETLAVSPDSTSNRGVHNKQGSFRSQTATSGGGSGRSNMEDESLTTHRGENHIFITAGSCGFIGAAKALGVNTKKGFWRACYSFIRRTLQNREKTQLHIDSIMEELLMLADRKPHEFHQMFHLRRVLLRDPNSVYYPAYICSLCYARLEASVDFFMKPIIHKTLLEVHPVVQMQNSPVSTPSIRKYPRHLPKYMYSRQPSRLGI